MGRRGGRAPGERYRLLYFKVFEDLSGLSHGMALGADVAQRLPEVRSRAPSQPCPGEIRALEAAAHSEPRETMTPAEIRALAAAAIIHLHQVAGKLTELSALLGDHESARASHERATTRSSGSWPNWKFMSRKSRPGSQS